MAVPRVFHPVKKQDFTIRTTTVHKKFIVDQNSFATTESGYFKWEGYYTGEKLKIGSRTYPTNSIDGTYKHIIWKSIDSQYYRFPYDRCATLEHSNPRFSRKHLNITASVLRLPYLDYGLSIKPGSVEITNSYFGLNLRDDQNGNLYDVSLDTGSYTDSYNLVGYWSFDNEFRKFKDLANQSHDLFQLNTQADCILNEISFTSKVFEPDETSISKNVRLAEGVHTTTNTGSGFSGYFDGSSYVLTKHRDEFNFAQDQDFTIAFWIRTYGQLQNTATQNYNQIISKKGVIYKQTYGIQKTYLNDQEIEVPYLSSSFINENTDIYPYDFRLYNDLTSDLNKIEFRRSDGINTCSLTGSKSGQWDHIAATKSGSLLSLYINGTLVDSKTDSTGHCLNKHSLMFGANNMNCDIGWTGYLDEIRIFDRAYPQSSIVTLANNANQSMYQTSIVGNVFYRHGTIVMSGMDPKFKNIFDQQWNLKYRGTHQIYNYETLVRIKKGWFNHSTNSTLRRNPNSDLLIDDVTGSLKPYFHTIGLYNESNELVAIGKINQPIQLRDDVDLNLIVKFDG